MLRAEILVGPPRTRRVVVADLDLHGSTWLDMSAVTRVFMIFRRYGNKYVAQYVAGPKYECDPRDGTPIQVTTDCFEATISGNRLEGKMVSCTFRTSGFTHPKGLVTDKFWVIVSSNGDKLEGKWWVEAENKWNDITFMRTYPGSFNDDGSIDFEPGGIRMSPAESPSEDAAVRQGIEYARHRRDTEA
jgi:hypothetical protein